MRPEACRVTRDGGEGRADTNALCHDCDLAILEVAVATDVGHAGEQLVDLWDE